MASTEQVCNVEELPRAPAAQSSPAAKSSIRRSTRKVTVEPVLFVLNVCSQVMWLTSQDLQIDKACAVNVGLSAGTCAHLNSHGDLKATVNDVVASVLMYRSILEASIKAVWLLMLGSWSDRYNRRFPLIISICGLLGEALVYLIISFMPSVPVETVLLACLPYSLSGGTHALLMICFAYLADTSKSEKRTFRMGLLDAAYYLGSPVGLAISAPLLDAVGYHGTFIFVMIFYALTIVYVAVRLQGERKRPNYIDDETRTRRKCQESCDVSHLYQAVSVTVQSRPHHVTVFILLLILAMLFDSLPVWGESNVKYLFTHDALDWDHNKYSHWGTFSSLLSVCVMLVVVPLLSLVAHVPDGWLGVLGGVSRTVASILYGCVTSSSLEWLMWTGAVIGSAKNMAPVAIRSLLSKLSGSREIGQVFAVMALLETLVVLAAAPIYKSVYSATNEYRPATYNFLSAGFNLILTSILLGVTIQLKKVWPSLPGSKEEASSQSDTTPNSHSFNEQRLQEQKS